MLWHALGIPAPWGLLASQPSLLGESRHNERSELRNCGTLLLVSRTRRPLASVFSVEVTLVVVEFRNHIKLYWELSTPPGERGDKQKKQKFFQIPCMYQVNSNAALVSRETSPGDTVFGYLDL